MEDLFPVVIVIIGSIASIVSSSMKAKQQKAATERHKAAAAARIKAAQQMQGAQRQAQPIAAPVVDVVPAQVISPTVHPHLTPDCNIHDNSGSLNYTSNEGKDPCHEEQLNRIRTPEETAPPEQGGLTFDWTGDNMVKAVVMQEVLTRPVQRRAR